VIRARIEEEKFFDAIYPVSDDRIIIEAPHAGKPKSDIYTGFIGWELCSRYGWGGIISRTTRLLVDFNREADYQRELRIYQKEGIEARNATLRKLAEKLKWNGSSPLLYLSLHGANTEKINRLGGDFAAGTVYGETCPPELRDAFTEKLSEALKAGGAPHRGLKEAPAYSGHSSLKKLRGLFGENFFIIQLELSATLRKKFTDETISAIFLAVKGVLRELS